MRTVMLIALRDLRSRLRDRSALIVGFVAPVALALIISFAFRGNDTAFQANVAVVDLDGGEIAAIFIDEVLASDDLQEVFSLRLYDEREAARDSLLEGNVHVVIVIGEGLETITVLRSPHAPISGEIALSVAQTFAAQMEGVSQAIGLSVMSTLFGPEAFREEGFRPAAFEFGDFDAEALGAIDFEALAQEVAQVPLTLELIDDSAGSGDLSAASYFGPGMAMLFVFFILSGAPRSLLAEKQSGTLARLRAAPIAPSAIVLGKVLAVSLLGLASMCVVWLVTALVFGARWGNPLAVLALLIAFMLAALGITSLVSVLAETEAQADGYVSIVAFVFAMLGGNFIFLADLPQVLQRVALFTPNGWALQGFTTLVADGGGILSILGPLAAILVFAAITLALAVPGMRKVAAQ